MCQLGVVLIMKQVEAVPALSIRLAHSAAQAKIWCPASSVQGDNTGMTATDTQKNTVSGAAALAGH
jgi:hypothetical protein